MSIIIYNFIVFYHKSLDADKKIHSLEENLKGLEDSYLKM